jgi:hypothetical protein
MNAVHFSTTKGQPTLQLASRQGSNHDGLVTRYVPKMSDPESTDECNHWLAAATEEGGHQHGQHTFLPPQRLTFGDPTMTAVG